MKKQMMITMMVVATFVATLAVLSVRAQNAGNFVVTIPFDCAVANKVLPAGDYYVRRSIEGHRVVLRIQSKDDSVAVYLPTTHPVKTLEIQSDSKLVFDRYGDQFFLSQVWIAGRSDGEELSKTSRERILQREMARRMSKPETVAIVGRSN